MSWTPNFILFSLPAVETAIRVNSFFFFSLEPDKEAGCCGLVAAAGGFGNAIVLFLPPALRNERDCCCYERRLSRCLQGSRRRSVKRERVLEPGRDFWRPCDRASKRQRVRRRLLGARAPCSVSSSLLLSSALSRAPPPPHSSGPDFVR